MKFRKLRADEVDCRISTISDKGLSLLLYKDARCDMNILDETVGPMNWQRSHSRDNANCTVSIYDTENRYGYQKKILEQKVIPKKKKVWHLTVLSVHVLIGGLVENCIQLHLSGLEQINVN